MGGEIIQEYGTFEVSNFFLDKTIKKIVSFSELPKGWDYGSGEPATSLAIELSICIYQIGLANQFKGDAFPDTNGGVIVSLFIEDNFVDVTINSNGDSLSWRREKGIGENYQIIDEKENSNIPELIEVLKSIQSECFSLEPYTSTNIIPTEGGFQASASKNLMVGFQFLRKNVPSRPQDQFVRI